MGGRPTRICATRNRFSYLVELNLCGSTSVGVIDGINLFTMVFETAARTVHVLLPLRKLDSHVDLARDMNSACEEWRRAATRPPLLARPLSPRAGRAKSILSLAVVGRRAVEKCTTTREL